MSERLPLSQKRLQNSLPVLVGEEAGRMGIKQKKAGAGHYLGRQSWGWKEEAEGEQELKVNEERRIH